MGIPIWKGATSAYEGPTSGGLKLAELIGYTQIFVGNYLSAWTLANLHYRGSVWTLTIPSGTATFFVEDTTLERDRGGQGRVTINYKYTGVVPPDEWSMPPFEDNPPIERNPFFASLSSSDLAVCKQKFESASAMGQTTANFAMSNIANNALAQKLVQKWLKGEETYYLAALRFTYTQYSYSGFTVTLGGFRQTPVGPFAGLAPGGMSWIRQADEPSWNNGVYKLTMTWLGANATPGWDSDLYP